MRGAADPLTGTVSLRRTGVLLKTRIARNRIETLTSRTVTEDFKASRCVIPPFVNSINRFAAIPEDPREDHPSHR